MSGVLHFSLSRKFFDSKNCRSGAWSSAKKGTPDLSPEMTERGFRPRKGLVQVLLAGVLALNAMEKAQADEAKVKVGVLKLSSSAPVFIAQDKG